MLNVTDMQILHRYAVGVMTRAKHHAPQVVEILPEVLGHVLLCGKNFSLHGSGRTNCMWFDSVATGRRYAFSYSHTVDAIELRDNNLQGPTLHQINSSMSRQLIAQIFAAL
jgi:hypothetical protein